MSIKALVRGGGDLASGVVLRLARAGCFVLVTELPEPLAVRRSVSFAQAVFDRGCRVEEVSAKLISDYADIERIFTQAQVAVVVDPDCKSRAWFHPQLMVDGRMLKRDPHSSLIPGMFQVGLGPGFFAAKNCHAVIETKRGPHLGRVIWDGEAENDTMVPEDVRGFKNERVIRAPVAGKIIARAAIGDILQKGQQIAEIHGSAILSPFEGILRGLIQDGLQVDQGVKIGDVDPRLDPELCSRVSDKALAIGGGVMEAVLSQPDLRKRLCE